MSQDDNSAAILHILVIGFHHQRGTQVEFCYPEIKVTVLHDKADDEIVLPKQWQALPYLSMPDGAHNYEEDSSFFHLPALTKGNKLSTQTVFGISCFRQIDSKKLKKKDDNLTRTQVQKSVCILMKAPLYGFVLAKLQLVTHAYFNELDFSRTEILSEFFDNMALQLSSIRLHEHMFHLGFGLQNVVINFKQQVLVMLKVLLLEKRLAVWGNPVYNQSPIHTHILHTILFLCIALQQFHPRLCLAYYGTRLLLEDVSMPGGYVTTLGSPA